MNGTLKCIVAALSFAGCMPAAYAQDGCKPVNGRFEASVVPPGVGHCPNIAGLPAPRVAFGAESRVNISSS